jgi:8-oxo-dGTP pyrophosphatase MutT (NUDIX family)
MRKAVCVILKNGDKILGVSRKDNHTLFGLVGGKVDDTDNSLEEAAIRECKEETNLDIFNLRLIDSREYGISEDTLYEQNCFIADWEGELLTQEEYNKMGETGVVKWIDTDVLINGFFGDYNKMVLEKIKNL